jgi:hypothetical protein
MKRARHDLSRVAGLGQVPRDIGYLFESRCGQAQGRATGEFAPAELLPRRSEHAAVSELSMAGQGQRHASASRRLRMRFRAMANQHASPRAAAHLRRANDAAMPEFVQPRTSRLCNSSLLGYDSTEPRVIMNKFLAALVVVALSLAVARAKDWVEYAGKSGPGQGKHIVFLSGDEEYRSEEGLPQLAKILSQRHGFKCTVLFSIDTNGVINPNAGGSLTHPEALDSADAIVMLLRFRHWNDDAMKHFEAALNRGVPIIALRTSTHAFSGFPKGSAWEKWNWNNQGGFGKQVLGETWVDHWGKHKSEATRGVMEENAKSDPLLRGVEDVFGTTDVYEAHPPADVKILLRGQSLAGMKPTDPPADYKRKTQGINDPMMPVAWTREYKNGAGKVNRVFCTTMGAATDLENEGLRRLLVNSVYWGLGLDVPAKANVDVVGEYQPTMYGFGSFKKGTKPGDYELK